MKLMQVTLPPLDGTEFVVVWECAGLPFSNMYKVDNNLIYERKDDGCYSHRDGVVYVWEDDLDAKFFVVGE